MRTRKSFWPFGAKTPSALYGSTGRSYRTFEDALKEATAYNDSDISEMVAVKTRNRIRELREGKRPPPESLSPEARVIDHVFESINPKRPLGILEPGGACGAGYFTLSNERDGRINRWHVVETEAMAASGHAFSDAKLTFFTNMAEAAGRLVNKDLVIANGVLQYLPDPAGTLHQFFSYGFAWVFAGRTIVGLNIPDTVITNQISRLRNHGPGSAPMGSKDKEIIVPLTIFPEKAFMNTVRSAGDVAFDYGGTEPGVWIIDGRKIKTLHLSVLIRNKKGV